MMNGELNFVDQKMLRIKAEERHKEKKIEQTVMEADMSKLIHELQVHQIELEMQGEELQKAYEIAETSRKMFTMLYDLAPIGFFILNSDGSISDLNFTAADLLHERRFSLVNSNLKLYISEEYKIEFNNFFTKVYTTNSKESCKVVLGYDGHPLSLVYMEGIVMGDDHKCLLSVVDISAFV